MGFGLWKRDRNFDHYLDLEANYHGRPSAWVEALGDWGAGSVYLIEIPSDAEKYDNIVAFWMPEIQTGEGKEYSFSYRLHFLKHEIQDARMAKVISTRVGGSGTDSAGVSGGRKFVVEFGNETLRLLGDKAIIEADISASSGRISNSVVQKNVETGNWRMTFELTPEKDKDPVELRALLRSNGEAMTETWVYQWSNK